MPKLPLLISSFLRYLILFSILFTADWALAQPAIPVSKILNQGYIGNSVSIFQDTSSALKLEQIKNNSALFKTATTKVPNFGISHYSNWIKFTTHNNTDRPEIILSLSNPIIDRVTLYVVRANGIDTFTSNNFSPVSRREFNHQFYIWTIPLKADETITCYLNLQSNQQILAPIRVSTAERNLSLISNADTQTGIYLGIMMVMLLYNLFIYFSVRDRDYIIYCHYIFWVALTQATLLGFSFRYLWGSNAWMAQHMMTLCGAMSGVATILFAQSFLKTRTFTPRLQVVLNGAIVLYIGAIVLLVLDYQLFAYQLVNLIAVAGSLLVMSVAWIIYRKKYKPAQYFLIGWSAFFISVIVFVFKDYDILPYNSFTIHSIEIGSAVEAIFLSFALAGKINILKKEKELSQAEALTIAKENERIIREQNVILEARVNERTVELSKSNSELNQTLTDLKEAEAQLVESEKMASLGQLTAGIAHEINNPINFVTSNIKPLKRDIGILLETIDAFETVGISAASPQDKRQQIDDYKQEIDFEYLKMEIGHLLNGINEGASRTAEIVKGLRIFSRLDEDDLKKADLNEGLESTLIIVNNLIGNNIQLQKEYADLPLLECYPGKLNQVFLNIISNALYAIKKQFGDSPGGILRISTSHDQQIIIISIADNGIGMDPKTQKKIFEPFFTTKDVGEGTGLGMSIAYNTIRKHRGEIHISSTPGLGTEFKIELPLSLVFP